MLKQTEAADWFAGQATHPHEEAKEVLCWSPKLLWGRCQALCMWSKGLLQQTRYHFCSQTGTWSWHKLRGREMQDTPPVRRREFTSPLMLSIELWVKASSDPCCLPGLCTVLLGSDELSESWIELHQIAKGRFIGSNECIGMETKPNKEYQMNPTTKHKTKTHLAACAIIILKVRYFN